MPKTSNNDRMTPSEADFSYGAIVVLISVVLGLMLAIWWIG